MKCAHIRWLKPPARKFACFLLIVLAALHNHHVESTVANKAALLIRKFRRFIVEKEILERAKYIRMDESICEKIITGLRSQKVKAVVFDFDLTISLLHSGGRVHKDKFAHFLEGNISPCFRYLLPRLMSAGFMVGVATFADSFRSPETHIAGEDLVRAFFQHHFGQQFRDSIHVVAAYPENYQIEETFKAIGLLAPMPMYKEYHLQRLSQLWKLDKTQIALVDDDIANIKAARASGYGVRHVRLGRGVTSDDLLVET